MQLTSIKIRNFRGIYDAEIDLHEKLNVFFGENGAGKSTVLDAAAILLSWLVNRIRTSGASGRPITESDITNHHNTSVIEATAFHEADLHWRLAKTRKGHKVETRTHLTEVNALAEEFKSQISDNQAHLNLPLLIYYPVNRAVLDIPLRIRTRHEFSLLSAFDDSLSSGANFRVFFEWFRERQDYENELFRENSLFLDAQLEAVRNAIAQMLPGFRKLRVRRNPLRMEIEKNGEQLTVDQLSDGEKCLLALVGDLARRLAIANPVRTNPLEGEAIVLIDEIDLHLHPQLQRDMIPSLQSTFPHCQWLISTHSPHILNHVMPEQLISLKQTESGIIPEQPRTSYGKNAIRTLEDLMGLETTRPQVVADNLRRLFQTIDRGSLSEAEKQLEELERQIGEDPDLVKATVMIKRKELLGA